MQLFPESCLNKLGFHQIQNRLTHYCLTENAREIVEELRPHCDVELLQTQLLQTFECLQLILLDNCLTNCFLPNLSNPNPILAKASILDNYITELEALKLLNFLQTTQNCKNYLNSHKIACPTLAKLLDYCLLNSDLAKKIQKIITPDGRIYDNASTQLLSFRRNLHQKNSDLRTLLNKILKKAHADGYTNEKELAIRNHKLTIPIFAVAKNKVHGTIQAISSTGQTLYIEPSEALSLNNEIQEYTLKEQNETLKILTQLTNQIRPQIPQLQRYHYFITQLDFIHSKAKLAEELKAQLPTIDANQLRWVLI